MEEQSDYIEEVRKIQDFYVRIGRKIPSFFDTIRLIKLKRKTESERRNK